MERVGERQSLRPGKAHTGPHAPTLISSNMLAHSQCCDLHTQTLVLTHKGPSIPGRSAHLSAPSPQPASGMHCYFKLLSLLSPSHLNPTKSLVAPIAFVQCVPFTPPVQLHCTCLLHDAPVLLAAPAAPNLAHVTRLCLLPPLCETLPLPLASILYSPIQVAQLSIPNHTKGFKECLPCC